MVAEKVTVPAKYSHYANVFSKEAAAELLKYSSINKHAINLELGKQLPYRPIYSLGLVELKTLKTYINTNLASGFIRLSKSLAGTTILFVWKLDGSLHLCIDYRDLNNFTIKNWYLFPLIKKLLD